jgi:hypothetical protein
VSIQSEDLKEIDSVIFNNSTLDAIKTVKLNNDIIWTKFKLKGKFEDGSFYFFKNMQLHLYKHTDASGELAITHQGVSIYIDENGFMSAPWGTDVSWEEKIDVGFDLREFDYLMVEGYHYSESMDIYAQGVSVGVELIASAVQSDDAVAMTKHIVFLESIDNEMGVAGAYTGKYGEYYRGASSAYPPDEIQANDAVSALRQVVYLDMNGMFYIDNTITNEYILKVCADMTNSRLFIDTSPFKGAPEGAPV